MLARGRYVNSQLVPVRSPRLLDRVLGVLPTVYSAAWAIMSSSLNWKSPHHVQKRKEKGHFSTESVNCYGRVANVASNKESGRTLDVPQRNRAAMQARSGEF